VPGHMGEPEGKEHRVVAAWRLPAEHIRLDELDRPPPDVLACQGKHLRRGVDGGTERARAARRRVQRPLPQASSNTSPAMGSSSMDWDQSGCRPAMSLS
jgi:hypothetical protein